MRSVVVVGLGAAGVAAAVTAHDLGARSSRPGKKRPKGEEGGNTRVAGQGYLEYHVVPAEQAIAYLTALCGPYTIPETMAWAWAEETCRNNEWLRRLGGDHAKSINIRRSASNLSNLPGLDCA